jgi:class I fructose-bisphosphate aldolase/fructose-bisphosphate aldolase/2-amino-3,7-dideoxy-D-threo-hept-6-ulosonate synthase
MSGKNIRLAKIFSNGKPVIVAVDHGSYQGPLPGIENLPQALRQFAKADGVFLMPGMVSACSGFFNSKTSPTCSVRG